MLSDRLGHRLEGRVGKPLKVLNTYAGIGGNRAKWRGVEVTAVEIDPDIASIYKSHFPEDTVIVGDAHEYLINHFDEFEFVWASPPCPTHSSFRANIHVPYKSTKPVYPDMVLYQEIIVLKQWFRGLFCVENVMPYYEALIPPSIVLQRHPFWCNFEITKLEFEKDNIRRANVEELQGKHGFDLSQGPIVRRKDLRKILRNCVSPEVGGHILKCALFALRES